jgi:hypothetical protein
MKKRIYAMLTVAILSMTISVNGCTNVDKVTETVEYSQVEETQENVSRETFYEIEEETIIQTEETSIEETTEEETTLPPLKEGYNYAWVSVMGRLNVREKAKKSSELVGHVKYRQRIVVKGSEKKKGFYKVTATDCDTGKEIVGYCSVKYVTFEQPAQAKVQLDVPLYLQTDEKWASVTLGNSGRTMKDIGCTTCCLAMSESFLKQKDVLPTDMEKKLLYTSRGSLEWPKKYDFCYDKSVYLEVALEKLQEGIPVLIGCERKNGRPHWVLITGYTGDGVNLKAKDFVINDPLPYNRTNLKQYLKEYPVFQKLVFYTGVDRVEETEETKTTKSK